MDPLIETERLKYFRRRRAPDASLNEGLGLNRRRMDTRMKEAAQKRSGPGTATQMCANHPNHPSGGLIAAPIPVIANEIVSGAEDLAPGKERQFAAVGRHGRAIHRPCAKTLACSSSRPPWSAWESR